MKQYEIVKIGERHEIQGEFFSQDVIEIYPLDDFAFSGDMAEEILTYIKSVDPDLEGAFPILEFEDGDYIRCVGVMGIIGDDVVLTTRYEPVNLADNICKEVYYNEQSKVMQWSKLMRIVEDNDLFERIVDFVDCELVD